MKPEAYAVMGARLDQVRETLDRIVVTFRNEPGYPAQIERRLREEEAGLVDALVGDHPLVLASIDHLRKRWEGNDLVLHDENGPRIKLGGNEHWIFADVEVGDDYGAHDFDVKHAIWRNTGALYRLQGDGSVADDPFFVPDGSPYTGPVER